MDLHCLLSYTSVYLHEKRVLISIETRFIDGLNLKKKVKKNGKQL